MNWNWHKNYFKNINKNNKIKNFNNKDENSIKKHKKI